MTIMPKAIEDLVNEATLRLHETHSLLKKLKDDSDDEEEDDGSSTEDKSHIIQLILQYRLSCEDALSLLFKMDQNLLRYLGVHPQQSSQVNKDRLAYALGNEDLKQILNVLAILTGSLSKIILRDRTHHASFSLKNKKPSKYELVLSDASHLLSKQHQFIETIDKLHLSIEDIIRLESSGPIFDHIAALRGPISQFYQAALNGLEEAETLYAQINKTPVPHYELNSLIKKTEEVLHSMPNIYRPQLAVPMKQFDHKVTSEQLEQKAAAKRLRPFFG